MKSIKTLLLKRAIRMLFIRLCSQGAGGSPYSREIFVRGLRNCPRDPAEGFFTRGQFVFLYIRTNQKWSITFLLFLYYNAEDVLVTNA